MYINKINISNLQLSELLKFSILDDSIFFDIETTGLNAKYDKIISINTLVKSNNKIYIYQFFSDSDVDEKKIIKEFISLIYNKKYIVTYNGNSFDIPFINKKSKKYNYDFTFDNYIKIDLLNDIYFLRNKLNLVSLKLKAVEEYFSIKRKDSLNGKDIIRLYTSYLLNNKKEYRDLILQHNFEDVFNLPLLFDNIMNSYDDTILFSYFENKIIVRLLYDKIKISKKSIIIKLFTFKNLKINYVNYSSAYEYYWDSNSGIITVTFRPYIFSNEKIDSFLYLLNEDYNIKGYIQIDNMRKDLIPIKYSDKIFYKNIQLIIRKIISTIK